MSFIHKLRFFLAIALLPGAVSAQAETVRIAVASNFSPTLKVLATLFESQTEYCVAISAASSGKHYLQIRHGAPFDIFMSADNVRPMLLEQFGLVKPDSRLTYAIGRLVLWAGPKNKLELDEESLNAEAISAQRELRIAIANPRLAPYGIAAQEVLSSLDILSSVKNKLVRGENINQAFQFVATGNALFGFVAFSQLLSYDLLNQDRSGQDNKLGNKLRQKFWMVPQQMYSPILQDAVRLSDSSAAIAFMKFLSSEPARKIIRESGYNTIENAGDIDSSAEMEAL